MIKLINNKYKKLYYSIIEKAKTRNLNKTTYVEIHHIIPTSLSGTNEKSNLIRLTAREHYLVHQLLPKFTLGKNKMKMIFAFECMNNRRSKTGRIRQRYINSKTYERYRIIFSENKSHSLKGRIFSEETKAKMALAKIGTKRSEEVKAKLSLNHKSKRYGISKETCEKISKANKGKVSSMKGKKHSKETILKMKNRDSNINERIGLKNKEINEIKRLEKLGIKSKEQFIKLGKKCKTLNEFRNSLNCEWSYVEKCLKHWFNSSSFYKAFNKIRP